MAATRVIQVGARHSGLWLQRVVTTVMGLTMVLLAYGERTAMSQADGDGQASGVYPGASWARRSPEQVGLVRGQLEKLKELVGGHGCVVRNGYMVYTWGDPSLSIDVASAVKPVISTLLLLAVQEGRLRSVDEKVADFEPRLKDLNRGKDGQMTWRHLASQTSGYGLTESPGAAWAYNDLALALYYDVLTEKVFAEAGTKILKTRLGDVLQFEDFYTFEAFGPEDRPGRLAISVRDFARFGLLYLRGGRWKGKQVVDPKLVRLAISSPIPADTPLTSGQDAQMLPGQRSLGGGKNITPVGPGYYSFNWWLNRLDRQGRRLYVDAPPDTYVASGHGGRRTLWIIPSLDLIVAWNDANVDDHDRSPGNRQSKCNQAARLMVRAADSARAATRPSRTRVSIVQGRWHINASPTYRGAPAEGLLMNVRMVNAVFEDANRPDFDPQANTDQFVRQIPDYVAHGIRAFTICLQGGMPGYEGAVNSAFKPDGSLRDGYLRRVEQVIEACDRQGAAVILGCYYQRQDQILSDADAVRAGVVNVARWIRSSGFANVLLEIANEFGHPGFDHRLLKTPQGQVELIRLAKRTAPELLVSTSGLGDGTVDARVAEAADFILIHFNSTPLEAIGDRIGALKRFGKPVVCNEDDKPGKDGARAAELCVANGASWGLMLSELNQYFPFRFNGHKDDPVIYATLKALTTPARSESR